MIKLITRRKRKTLTGITGEIFSKFMWLHGKWVSEGQLLEWPPLTFLILVLLIERRKTKVFWGTGMSCSFEDLYLKFGDTLRSDLHVMDTSLIKVVVAEQCRDLIYLWLYIVDFVHEYRVSFQKIHGVVGKENRLNLLFNEQNHILKIFT